MMIKKRKTVFFIICVCVFNFFLTGCSHNQIFLISPDIKFSKVNECSSKKEPVFFHVEIKFLNGDILDKTQGNEFELSEAISTLLNSKVCNILSNYKSLSSKLLIEIQITRKDGSLDKNIYPSMELKSEVSARLEKNGLLIKSVNKDRNINFENLDRDKISLVVLEEYIKPQVIEIVNELVLN